MDIGHLILYRFYQNTVDQLNDGCIGGGKLIETILLNSTLDFEIIGSFRNNGTEVVNLSNGKLFFYLLSSSRKEGLGLLIVDAIVLLISLDYIFFR